MVLSMLDAATFERISPWLQTQPGTVQYAALKKQLLQIFTIPVTVRAQRALDLMLTPLGDTRPSESWRELEKLVMLDEVDADGKHREISLPKEIFLRRLPRNVRAQIEDAEDMEMAALVTKADKLFLAEKASRYAATQAVNEVQEAPPPEPDQEDEVEVNAVNHRRTFEPRQPPHFYRQPHHRDARPHPAAKRFQQQKQHFRPPHPASKDCWCRYHKEFGTRAFRCSPPCSFSKN